MADNPEAAPISGDSLTTAQAQFLKQALEKTQGNLELLLGRSITIAPSEPRTTSGAAIKAALPAHGIILAIKSSGTVESRLVCTLAHPLGVVMSSIVQLKPEPMLVERLAGPPELSPVEQEGVREATSFIDAAIVDYAALATSGRIVLAPETTRFLPDGAELADLGERCLMIDGEVTIAPAEPARLALYVPLELADAWVAPDPKATSIFGSKVERTPAAPQAPLPAAAAPVAPPQAATKPKAASAAPFEDPDGAVWVAGRDHFVKTIQEAAGARYVYRAFGSFPELLAAVDTDPRPALVVIEVQRGAEFQLDLIGALRRHPAFSVAGSIVALEDASRRHVLRCGTLGLLDVVPLGLEPEDLCERIVSRVRRSPKSG